MFNSKKCLWRQSLRKNMSHKNGPQQKKCLAHLQVESPVLKSNIFWIIVNLKPLRVSSCFSH